MTDIKGLKIQKRTYDFEIKKRVSLEHSYKKVEKSPLEIVKEKINEFMSPKGKVVLEDAQELNKGPVDVLEEPKEKKQKGSFINAKLLFRVLGAFVLVVLLLGAVGLYFQSMLFASEVVLNPVQSTFLSGDIQSYDIITASLLDKPRQPYHTAYVRLLVDGQAGEAVQVSLDAYDSVVPSSVYLLRSHRYQAESYPEFVNALKSNLSNYGIPVNEIGIEELASLPSQSLVIVSSGYVPEELLTQKNTKITNLLERGVTVVYIGQPFYRMYSQEGAIVSANPAALDPFRITFDEENVPLPTSELNMRSPLYVFGGGNTIWGAISTASYGPGYLIALPQTLDGGWVSGSEAADDVSRLIIELPWLSPIGTASEEVLIGENGTITELFTSTFEGNTKYLRVKGDATESPLGFAHVIYAKKSTNGELYTEGHEILPSGLGSTSMDIVAALNEPGGEARLFMSVTEFGIELERDPIATTKVALNSQPTFPFTFTLPSGNYILNILDGDGNKYARSYLRAGTLEIVEGSHSTGSDVYVFYFYLDGNPVKVNGKVYINGNPAHSMEFNGVNKVEVRASEIVGGPLADSQEHSFTFELGEYTFTQKVYKGGTRSLLTDPMILGAVGLAVVILGIGIVFARKGVAMYGLDVPDFPPQSIKKIPLKQESLLAIFDKINERYKWKDTPLTLGEIKSGFRDILYEGKPVFISDYNLEYILSRLVGMGVITKELNYYGKTSWEKDSGESIRYLAFFRKLRDICINNAVPFTPMGQSKNYDSKITIIGQDIYVHLYDEPTRVIRDALASLKDGLNIILFEDEAEKSEFYEYLSSGYEGGTILKLEIQAGSVLLKTWDEFAEMIKEMKV